MKISTLPIPPQYIFTEVCESRHNCVFENEHNLPTLQDLHYIYMPISTILLLLQYISLSSKCLHTDCKLLHNEINL